MELSTSQQGSEEQSSKSARTHSLLIAFVCGYDAASLKKNRLAYFIYVMCMSVLPM